MDTKDENAGGPDAWAELTQRNLASLEAFGRNITEAALRSNTMLAEMAAKGEGASAPDPDPFHVAPDMARVWSRLASDPDAFTDAHMRLWSGYAELWSAAAKRATSGEGEETPPARGDKRWRSKDWSENPMFDLIKQSYLMTSQWLVDTVEAAPDLDDDARRRARFFTRQIADAFSPTNFPLTNPDVLRETMQSGGENLARGLRNLAEDLERGKGRLAISQTDLDQFEVGRDVATAPGQVIFQNDILQLIHYEPHEKTTFERPLLIFPPWINKFYILDLRPENSMVRWLLDQGHEVFLVSWVNPDASLKDKTFEDYMREGIFAALEATLEQSGADAANTVGYCIGGTLLSSTLAYMAQTGDERIASATFFAAQADFSDAGELSMFTSDEWFAEIERRMDANGGVLDGSTMADVFNMLRANDLIWSFVVNNYLLGKAPRPFDLLFWNADQTRLPKALHLFYLDQFYRKNALAEGKLELGGKTLDLADIKTPAYFQASREDHIAPFRSVYRGARRFGGPTRFMLAGSGHIAGVINHPDAKKYQHWINTKKSLPDRADEWLEAATEKPGSWWPDWHSWLSKHAGERTPALAPGKGPLKAIEPAPGSYVKVTSG